MSRHPNYEQRLDESWNPMREAFHDPHFNTYRDGPGANLKLDNQPGFTGSSQKRSGECKLYVGNIPLNIEKEGIENIFRTVGQPLSVFRSKVPSNNNRTWAFVTFASYREAENAMRELNRRPPMFLNIEFARGSEPDNTVKARPFDDIERPSESQAIDRRKPRSSVTSSKGRGLAVAPSADPRASGPGVTANKPVDIRQFQPYSGSNYEESNTSLMQGVQRTNGPGGPRKFVMGRGCFDKEMDGLCQPKKLQNVVENEYEAKSSVENYLQKKNGIHEYSQKEFPPNFHQGTCTLCRNLTTLFCAGCEDWYCSRNCQEKDWPRHKKYCKQRAESNKQCNEEIPEGNDGKKFPSRQTDVKSGELPNQQRNGGYQNKTFRDNSTGKRTSPRVPKGNNFDRPVKGSCGDEIETSVKVQNQNKEKEGAKIKSPQNKEIKSPRNNTSQQMQGRGSKYLNGEVRNFRPENEEQSDKTSENSVEKQSKPVNSGDRSSHYFSEKSRRFAPHESVHKQENALKAKHDSEPFIDSAEKITKLKGCEECEQLCDKSFTKVIIQVVLGPGEYWVQLASNIKEVYTMSQEMRKRENADPVNLSVGAYCMAKYGDDWCRAKIVSLKPKPKISFIDFGNEELYQANDLLTLPDTLKVLRSQAIRIKLASGTNQRYQKLEPYHELSVKTVQQSGEVTIVHVEGEIYKQSIEEKCTTTNSIEVTPENHNIPLQSITVLLKSDMTCRFSVVEYNSDSEFLAILLPTFMGNVYNSLFDMQFQDELENTPLDSFIPEIGDAVMAHFPEEGWVRAYVLYVSPEEEITVASCDLGFVDVTKKVKKMPARCREIAQFIVQCSLIESSKVKGIEKYQGNVRIECSTCDSATAVIDNDDPQFQGKIEVKKWVPPYELYQELKCVELKNGTCVVSAEMSAVELYIRPMTDSCIETYNRLLQDVAKYCFSSPALKYSPKVGQVLAAKFTEDGNYYRAVVREVHSSKGVKVQYIDFGNIEYVPVDTLKPLSEKLRAVECCVIKVVLEDVVDRPLNEEVQKLFKNLILENIKLTVKSSDPKSNKVQLYTKDGASLNEKINQILVPGWKKGIVDKNIYTVDDVKIETLEPDGLIDLVIMSVIGDSVVVRPEKSKIANVLEHDIQPAIEEYCAQTKDPYTPRDMELCLANTESTWWRCLCVSGGNPLQLYRLDVGDVINASHEHIRRYLSEFTLLPAVGIRCEIRTKVDYLDETIKDNIQMYLNTMKVVTAKVVQPVAYYTGLKSYIIMVPELDEYLQTLQ